MPDQPATAKWLTPRERAMCVLDCLARYWIWIETVCSTIRRVAANQNGIKSKTFRKDQFIEALTDWRVWLVVSQTVRSPSRHLSSPADVGT
jgi:hypothetical protein